MKKVYTAFALLILLTVNFSAKSQCNNILANGDAESGITGWTFSSGSGTTWVTQNNTYGQAFVASYGWSTMSQQVDLLASGYTQPFLNGQPKISYMQMFKGHTVNFADSYYYKIELLNSSNTVLATYSYGSQTSPIITTSVWDTVAGSFTNYGSGLRYVKVQCGGKDVEYWAGNYGTYIDNSVVSVAQEINVGICSGTYAFGNQTLSASGTYQESFIGQYGCDSSVILNLNVGSYNIADTFDFCDGDTFYFDGQAITQSDTLNGNFLSLSGCDSIVDYVVNFHPSYDDSLFVNVCPGQFYTFGTQILFGPGVYTHLFSTANGCDSNVVLTLGHFPSNVNAVTDYICSGETYFFGTTAITTSGIYNGVFPNQYGCDSIVTLTLLESESYNVNLSKTLCNGQSLVLGTQVITETGFYTEHFFTTVGSCDSIVNVNVTAHHLNNSVDFDENTSTLTSNETQSGVVYRWLNCENNMSPISGALSNSYTSSTGGRFAVEISLGGCRDTSACRRINPLGDLTLANNQTMTIFPNPAKTSVQITFSEMMDEVAVFNVQGQIVYRSSFQPTKNLNIPIEQWSNGFYTISVKSNGEIYKLPLSVQH